MSPKAQDRCWFGAVPVMEQCERGSDALLQVMPARAGRLTGMVTAFAVAGPPLPTVIVKPTPVPASTGVASAVLVIARLVPRTTIVVLEQAWGALLADAQAV